MRPSPYGSLRTWTTRAVQRISCAEFPVTSAGIRRVASMGIPTWRGADEAKKKPPRETFKASVKCSVLSEATPRARKRSGVRRLRRASCRRSVAFILSSPREEGSGADSRESDGGYLQRNRASRAVKYQSWHGQEVPVPVVGWSSLKSTARM